MSVARPKSEDKRSAIISAAIRVIERQGLSAPTALIAREAGVSNGSLFTYFETKADLFNQLYVELKNEMASAALEGTPAGADLQAELFHSWSNWMQWAVANVDKRRALAQLSVSDDITAASRARGHQAMAPMLGLMQRLHANSRMHSAPFAFVAGILNALAEATMDFIIQDPANAEKHSKVGFEAAWRALE